MHTVLTRWVSTSKDGNNEMPKKQTIYLAAPGFQSVDNWLPIACEQFKSGDKNVVLLFPYFWVIELIPQNDLLMKIIKEIQIPISLPMFGTKRYLLFQSIDDARTYIRLSRTVRDILDSRLSLKKSSTIAFIQKMSRLAVDIPIIFKLRFLGFQNNGVLVWDLLNIQSEPAVNLRNLTIRTKNWRRISINVSPIYAELPTLEGKQASSNDRVISFSEEQTRLMQLQYAIDESNIYKSPVPRHHPNWIQFLQGFSSVQNCKDYKFVLLVSRGIDPPLLTYEDKMLIFSTIIEEICGKKKFKLLVKLHPNEDQMSFQRDLDFIRSNYSLEESVFNNVSLTQEHVLVVAAQAEFGIAYFSGTIADMVRVGCPAIQFLLFKDNDSSELKREKLLLDKGMAELVKSIDSFAPTVDRIIHNHTKSLTAQSHAYNNYFYSGKPTESFLLPFPIVPGSI
jgi:hypothetical protein